jgi:predicted PurR-regulated permease PerM
LSGRSIAVFVALFGLTLLLLRILSAASRVIGWMLVAVALAGLLDPIVVRLTAKMRRGLAVLVVFFVAVLAIGGVTYGLVGDISRQLGRLQETAPAAAQRFEEGPGQLSEAARTIDLSKRVDGFLKKAPERLSGRGTALERFRAATTRGLAVLTTTILTLFLLLHGRDIANAATEQIHDSTQRERVREVALRAYHRAFGYARGTLGMAMLAGLVAYSIAYVAGIPGAAALAVWVALWDVVPVAGAVIGATPIVLLAAVASPVRGILLAALFIAYQCFEQLGVQRVLERRTLRLGPFLTIAAGLAGFEMRGAAGALLALLLVAYVAAVLDDISPGGEPVPDLPEDATIPVPG